MATREPITATALSYRKIDFDDEGWAWDTDYKPYPFDIAFVHLERGDTTRVIPAWWTGSRWMGRKIRPGDKIIKWRRDETPSEKE